MEPFTSFRERVARVARYAKNHRIWICGVPFDWSDNKGDYVHFYGRENCETGASKWQRAKSMRHLFWSSFRRWRFFRLVMTAFFLL